MQFKIFALILIYQITNKPTIMQVQYLISIAQKNNFEEYLDCQHPNKFEYPNINCLIMTCTSGKYDGEVVEANWNYNTGEVVSFNIYSQFNDNAAKFKI